MTRTSDAPWHSTWTWLLAFLILLTLGIRFAEPIRDGDLWWQMAYGRYLIENRTLIPDHTVFTWTPVLSTTIYCAWIPEILLYLFYQLGGLPVLFAFRYLCVLIFVLAVFLQARRLGVTGHPMTWLICLIGLLMSQSAAFIKPEIFSYVLMTITVMTWWNIKSSGEAGWRYCYLFPALMVIWVNSHGAFIFGATFLCVMGLGETINIFLSPKSALSPKVRRHLFIGLFLSGLAIFATPYGWQYPAYLIESLLGKSMERFGTIRAYTSVFDARVQHYHYTQYLFLAGLILLALMWYQVKRRRLDWALILTNLAFAILYTRFLRTTYNWAPIFSLSAISLLSHREGWAWPKRRGVVFGIGGAIAVVCVALAVRAGLDAMYRPYGLRWFGFGIAYHNPVEEAEFIRTNLAGYRLGNDYSAGGYLLWALWPDMKVLIDPRQFPFKEWYGQYREFSTGRNVNDFVRNYPCEVWSIRYEHTTVVSWFLGSPDWKVAFFGPSGVVFARKDIRLPDRSPQVGQGTGEMKNINQAMYVFMFAVSMQDEDNARRILAGMREHFKYRDHRRKIQAASDWLEGTLAYFRRDYEKAVTHLEACRRNGISSEPLLVSCYDHLTVLAWSRQDDQGALSAAKAALAIKPGDRYAVFNARIIESYLREKLKRGNRERPRLARPAEPAFSTGKKGFQGQSSGAIQPNMRRY